MQDVFYYDATYKGDVFHAMSRIFIMYINLRHNSGIALHKCTGLVGLRAAGKMQICLTL